MDFVSDQLATGRRPRVFNLVDDYSRECVLQIVDVSISGERVARELQRLAWSRPLPKTIVCDNGPEFTSKSMFFWARESRVKLHFIHPGKPTQNAFVESFNGKFRDYCLNLHWFTSLQDARSEIDTWRDHYNHVRPHRSLGKKPPAVFAKEAAQYGNSHIKYGPDQGVRSEIRAWLVSPEKKTAPAGAAIDTVFFSRYKEYP
jgi:putative transposase